MAPFISRVDSRPRRSREAARRRERPSELQLESLEPRLALAAVAGLPDAIAPKVQSVSLPAAGTYGTGSALTFKLNFNEPVRVLGDRADVFLPVEVNYAMRSAAYVAGSGTKSLTFRMTVTANDVDTDGISLGRVNETSVRDFDFATDRIKDRAGNSAIDAIPAVNTSRIRIDATGPVVAGVGGFVTQGRNVSLKVTFDGPVTVTGRPTVPVTIGGVERELAYVAGSKTSTLTFAVKVPRGESVASPGFRGTNDLPGEVILLPADANLKDRLGNAVTPIGGNFGEIFTDAAGNRVVVIGTHYEALRTEDRRVTIAELSEILTSELDVFNRPSDNQTPLYWREYTNPTYPTPTNDVDLYRVAYRSTIPEQGNRPTISYGLVAIPHGATGKLPVVSYQHGTLFFKESAPSQAFSWDKNSTAVVKYGLTEQQLYFLAYETRLNVAQFAGNGYVVITADYFGIGNSVENDSFFVKGSEQQACLDMHSAAVGLLASKGLVADDLDLFLNGWSQGGLVTLSFQEALEARGVRISGVSTASAPSHTDMFAERFIFNPRSYSDDGTEVPDAEWSVFIHQFSSFALGGYTGQTNAPLELLGGNYEISRKFYMREFVNYPAFSWKGSPGNRTPWLSIDDVERSAIVSEFLDPLAASSPRAYGQTAYASLIRDVAAGKTKLDSDMLMYYGGADEGSPDSVATIIATWQRGTYGKTNIEQVRVPYASHRSTLLTAAFGQLDWFDSKRSVQSVSESAAATSSLSQSRARNGEIYAAVSDSGSFQIWAFTPDGKSRRQVTSRERDGLDRASHPSVSPDGTLIAFSGFTGDRADIYVINSDGTNLRKLTSSNASEYQMIPGFSPDGRLIAYCSSRGEPTPDTAHLRIMSVDGSEDRQLTPTTDGSYEDTGPKFSPRGDVILFGSDRNNTREHNDLYTINVDGTDLKRLTYGANNSYSRSWSPNGRRIVFNSQVRLEGADPGYGELRIIDANGRHERKLTSFKRNLRFEPFAPVPGGANAPTVRGDMTPAWSPDGKSVVFCGQSKRADQFGQYELFTIDLATKRRTQLTRSAPGTNHISAAWSVLPQAGLTFG